jgi:hypothetical protein
MPSLDELAAYCALAVLQGVLVVTGDVRIFESPELAVS